MGDPQSADEWWTLCDQHWAAAKAIASVPAAAGQALFHVGIGVECALKAYIMTREGLNRWPDRKERQDLYTHNLKRLIEIAQINVSDMASPRAAWHVVLQWDRAQGYDPRPIPAKVAKSMVEAGFGEEGVAVWLRKKSTSRG